MFANSKLYICVGCLFLATAGALAAFGFHGPSEIMTPAVQQSWGWAVDMQFYHGLGLVLVGVLLQQFGASLWIQLSGGLMILGTLVFSGLVYLEKLGVVSAGVAEIVPTGGSMLMISWLVLAVGVVLARR